MQKLTVAFISIVLILFILTGLYIRTSEAEKKELRSQIEEQTETKENSQDTEELETEYLLSEETASTAATPGTQLGTIEGSLSFPSSGIPDTLEICAENTQTKELICTGEIQKSDEYTYGFGYRLEAPEGTYLVYARLPNDPYRAYYSDFVTCGLAASCPSHKPIAVNIEANKTISNIDPQDWYDSNQ